MWYNSAINIMARDGIGDRGAGHVGESTPQIVICTLDAWGEHIVHIDGVTGSSPVAITNEPNRKARLLYI